MTQRLPATERFLARLGTERELFLQDHFSAGWGWYERLTVLCTAGQVGRWRERCVASCRMSPGDRVLDVGTGTGPLLLRARRGLRGAGLAVGLDISREGLGTLQTAERDGGPRPRGVQARALPLPFRDASFDCVLVGFALRHLGAPRAVLQEFRRVLTPRGRLGIVDFLRPRPGPAAWAGLAYLFWVVPVVALLLSRRSALYRLARYLPHTILDAPGADDLGQAMQAAGFAVETRESLCSGIVWLFTGRATSAEPESKVEEARAVLATRAAGRVGPSAGASR